MPYIAAYDNDLQKACEIPQVRRKLRVLPVHVAFGSASAFDLMFTPTFDFTFACPFHTALTAAFVLAAALTCAVAFAFALAHAPALRRTVECAIRIRSRFDAAVHLRHWALPSRAHPGRPLLFCAAVCRCVHACFDVVIPSRELPAALDRLPLVVEI
jgi:hypothetical protein